MFVEHTRRVWLVLNPAVTCIVWVELINQLVEVALAMVTFHSLLSVVLVLAALCGGITRAAECHGKVG